jgi:hypothetical protein
MDVFDKIGKARGGAKGVYFKDGLYVVEVQKFLYMTTKSNVKQFVMESKIVASTNPEMQPGTVAAQIVALKNPQYLETYLGDVKNYLAAMLGISDPDSYMPPDRPSNMTPEDHQNAWWSNALKWASGVEQPLAQNHTRAMLQCTTKSTKENRPFTQHHYGVYTQGMEDKPPFVRTAEAPPAPAQAGFNPLDPNDEVAF